MAHREDYRPTSSGLYWIRAHDWEFSGAATIARYDVDEDDWTFIGNSWIRSRLALIDDGNPVIVIAGPIEAPVQSA